MCIQLVTLSACVMAGTKSRSCVFLNGELACDPVRPRRRLAAEQPAKDIRVARRALRPAAEHSSVQARGDTAPYAPVDVIIRHLREPLLLRRARILDPRAEYPNRRGAPERYVHSRRFGHGGGENVLHIRFSVSG
jgi:hypothetical protein